MSRSVESLAKENIDTDGKGVLKNAARWFVAILLLGLLFKSGKLASLADLKKLFDSPWLFVFAILGFVVNYVVNFWRWEILLRGVGIDMPFSENVRLSMIGQFFSIFMPGAVGGDLIKAVYVAREYPKQRTDGIASILLDRILGFLTLLIFATFFFILSFNTSNLDPSLQGFALLLVFGTVFLLATILLPDPASRFLLKLKFKHPLIEKVAKTLKSFARTPITLLWGLLTSFVSQGGAIFGYYMLGLAIYGALPWGQMDLLRFISGSAVGTTAAAIPISPMGLGVGQVAFGKVFKLLGAPSEAYGIVVISAAQIIALMLNLLGAIWFLRSKKKHLN